MFSGYVHPLFLSCSLVEHHTKEVKQSMPALMQFVRSWAGSKARAVCEAVMTSSEARRLMNLPFMFATKTITNLSR